MLRDRRRSGFTLLELFVVVTVVTVLCSLLLPPLVNRFRETSRKQACAENIRHLGSAMLQYEKTYKRLTSFNSTWGYGGYAGIPFWNVTPGYGGAGRWSGMIALLPYLNEGQLYSEFHDGTSGRWNNQQLAWGPYGSIASAQQASAMQASPDVLRYAWSGQYKPSRKQVSVLRCPSDPGKMRPGSQWNLARSNYAFCLGDGQVGMNSGDPVIDQTRGTFQNNIHHTIAAITDGAANTIMFGEIATPDRSSFAIENQGVMQKDAKVQGRAVYELGQQPDFKGIGVNECRALAVSGRYIGTKRNWGNLGSRCYDALATYTGFNTVNPPNAGSCTPTNNAWGEGEGIYTASSYHIDGTHIVIFDGSVKFVHEGINTSDNRTGTDAGEYYSPGRTWANGRWNQTPNWTSPCPFGAWGAMGTRSTNDYCSCSRPVD